MHQLSDERLKHTIDENDSIIQWMMFLNAKNKEVLDMLAKKSPEIKKATSILEVMSRSKTDRILYEAREAQLRDIATFIEESREEGIKEGIEKGRQEGIEKGMEKGRQEGIEKGMEKGRQEGIEEGIEKGRKEGIEKGIKENLMENVISLLAIKFGAIPENMKGEISKLDAAVLKIILTEIFEYENLDDVKKHFFRIREHK